MVASKEKLVTTDEASTTTFAYTEYSILDDEVR